MFYNLSMRLIHYSDREISEVEPRGQHPNRDWKPRGLWVSVDDAEQNWRHWCESESFRDVEKQKQYIVTLSSSANIVTLSSGSDIDFFTQEYGRAHFLGDRFDTIDWCRVAEEYQGIIISPHQWSRRNNFNWYYSWDCASGCIWNPNAVESLTEIAVPDLVAS